MQSINSIHVKTRSNELLNFYNNKLRTIWIANESNSLLLLLLFRLSAAFRHFHIHSKWWILSFKQMSSLLKFVLNLCWKVIINTKLKHAKLLMCPVVLFCVTKQHDPSSSSHLKISFFVVISVSWHCLQHSDVHWGGEVRVRKYTCQMFSLKVILIVEVHWGYYNNPLILYGSHRATCEMTRVQVFRVNTETH